MIFSTAGEGKKELRNTRVPLSSNLQSAAVLGQVIYHPPLRARRFPLSYSYVIQSDHSLSKLLPLSS
jgi:hypothetical protein